MSSRWRGSLAARIWCLKPITISEYSFVMDASFSRMMLECASLSKIARIAASVYISCGLKSSIVNFFENIVLTTSCSTRDALSFATFCAVRRCSRM